MNNEKEEISSIVVFTGSKGDVKINVKIVNMP